MSKPEDYELTEPAVVDPLFVTTWAVIGEQQTVGIAGAIDLPGMKERRVLIRAGMSVETAEGLRDGLTVVLLELKRPKRE